MPTANRPSPDVTDADLERLGEALAGLLYRVWQRHAAHEEDTAASMGDASGQEVNDEGIRTGHDSARAGPRATVDEMPPDRHSRKETTS